MSEPLTEIRALDLDATCPLAGFRDRFLIPPHGDREQVYLCGNSLGLQPRDTRAEIESELDAWARHGVEGHFRGDHPWMHAHTFVREHLAELVGALPSEVVAMNTLTVNLHLMMASFYRPTAERHAILMEKHAFPSDRHAAESQIRFHGFDPREALIELEGDEANGTLSLTAIERALAEHGERIALVLMPGVQYLTGQALEMRDIVRMAHAQGCVVGLDLAHAAGNLHLALHDDGADFAVWCSYKYLNSGAGAVAGCFVHERHANTDRPRFAGWWGHQPETRFQMRPGFLPTPGADGWQLSNPPVLALAPLRASLRLFHEAGIERLRAKSVALTGTLAQEIETRLADVLDIVTPREPSRRGCQLSLRVRGGRARGRSLFEHLHGEGIVCDWREPDVIRASPTPLYNRYIDVLRFVLAVEDWRRSA